MTQEKGGGAGRQFRMWIDESLSFFFRRLSFSPDGNLLAVPGLFVVVYCLHHCLPLCLLLFTLALYSNIVCVSCFFL